VESSQGITGLNGAQVYDSSDQDDTKDAIKRFLHDFPLLPPPPAMIFLHKSPYYFEAPRSRREQLAEERALVYLTPFFKNRHMIHRVNVFRRKQRSWNNPVSLHN